MNKDNHITYILNVISLLKQLVVKAKAEATNLREDRKNYAQGLIMGYYSIITTLKHQAFVFCINQKALGLTDIRPDVDLIGMDSNLDVDAGEDNWAIDLMEDKKLKGYLIDSIILLKEQAIEAKKEADDSKKNVGNYNKGELMAYLSLFSLLKDQAPVFNIDEEEIGLTKINSCLDIED